MSDWVLLPEYLQRLWFVHSMAPDKSILSIGADVLIEGLCPPEELRAAFSAAVAEHDAFRLCFRAGKAGPECRIDSRSQWQWRLVDLGEQGDTLLENVWWRVAEEERLPLSPETGLVLRATLYLLGRDRAMLAVTAHHFVVDAWSVRIVVEDTLRHWRQLRGEDISGGCKGTSFLAALSRVSADCGAAFPASEPQNKFLLPLDNPLPPYNRSGRGGEVSIKLDGAVLARLRNRCGETGQTPFAGLMAAVLILLADVADLPFAEAGVVVTSRNPRLQARSAGCFVQLAPVFVPVTPDTSPSRLWTEVGSQVLRIRRQARRGEVSRPAHSSPVMVSMIQDSAVPLAAPAGVRVRYERRRRTQAEADLHVFFYGGAAGVEAVFNHDAEVLTSSTVASWAARYERLVRHVSEYPHAALGSTIAGHLIRGSAKDQPTAYRLQHVGIAAWELAIALRRLAAIGIDCLAPPWEDPETGVVMGLAGPTNGLQFEVVAPLRDGAPCVGTLVRNGEGPYHCCWRVPDSSVLLEKMRQCHVEHSVILRDGKSGLFPSESVTFMVVGGFGLVELLDGVGAGQRDSGASQVGARTLLCVRSDDSVNARRFLSLLGYRSRGVSLQPAGGEAWVAPERDHEFRLVSAEIGVEASLAWVDLSSTPARPGSALSVTGAGCAPEVATSWGARVRCSAASKREAHRWVLD